MKLRSLIALAPLALLACSGGTGDPNGPGGMTPMTPAKANVSVTQLDFGGVDCGGQDSDAKSVTIKNEGGSPLTWSASLTQADAFTLAGPTSGTIAAGESVSLGVVATARTLSDPVPTPFKV